MPKICRFFGVAMQKCFRDRQPPHFHAQYGDRDAVIRLDDLQVTDIRLLRARMPTSK